MQRIAQAIYSMHLTFNREMYLNIRMTATFLHGTNRTCATANSARKTKKEPNAFRDDKECTNESNQCIMLPSNGSSSGHLPSPLCALNCHSFSSPPLVAWLSLGEICQANSCVQLYAVCVPYSLISELKLASQIENNDRCYTHGVFLTIFFISFLC